MIERQGTRSTKHDGSTVLLRKILRELKEMKELNNDVMTDSITAGPVTEDNIYTWTATIIGPKASPYDGGIFLL